MAEKKMERNDSSSTLNGVGGRSTVVSEGWELDIVESNQVFAKLTARVAALEAENKLLNAAGDSTGNAVLAKLAGLETRLEGIERTLGELVVKQQQTPTTTTAGDKQQQKMALKAELIAQASAITSALKEMNALEKVNSRALVEPRRQLVSALQDVTERLDNIY